MWLGGKQCTGRSWGGWRSNPQGRVCTPWRRCRPRQCCTQRGSCGTCCRRLRVGTCPWSTARSWWPLPPRRSASCYQLGMRCRLGSWRHLRRCPRRRCCRSGSRRRQQSLQRRCREQLVQGQHLFAAGCAQPGSSQAALSGWLPGETATSMLEAPGADRRVATPRGLTPATANSPDGAAHAAVCVRHRVLP
jgi:hypothetical protein